MKSGQMKVVRLIWRPSCRAKCVVRYIDILKLLAMNRRYCLSTTADTLGKYTQWLSGVPHPISNPNQRQLWIPSSSFGIVIYRFIACNVTVKYNRVHFTIPINRLLLFNLFYSQFMKGWFLFSCGRNYVNKSLILVWDLKWWYFQEMSVQHLCSRKCESDN